MKNEGKKEKVGENLLNITTNALEEEKEVELEFKAFENELSIKLLNLIFELCICCYSSIGKEFSIKICSMIFDAKNWIKVYENNIITFLTKLCLKDIDPNL